MKAYKLHKRRPVSGQRIAVDTQIIYWVFYADDNWLTGEKPYQISKYSSYIKDMIETNAEIIVFGGVLLELFKIIEKNEYAIYLELNELQQDDLSLKQYRENEEERDRLREKIDIAYKQIKQVATVVYEVLDEETCQSFIDGFNEHKADFVDFSLVCFCNKESIKDILTDDIDFESIDSDIKIISGNRKYFNK